MTTSTPETSLCNSVVFCVSVVKAHHGDTEIPERTTERISPVELRRASVAPLSKEFSVE
jgi:hypothetical protein